ncbi:sugar phosphate isomerase/epimerase family protein [Salinibacterium soli]|uniref:Sugar phosphate isomerase/epimerase family protein n=1 Tax=Antiquaquibacter soli TaxID=3064523 RepID=A0ABT9BNE2_9MICO|nr:sugar phosphate isomerase/epimerase family protein [Protaetiibacter sp. WY-16]MDO7882557.1 sugar phosphate isomerase/epimerase family protein [Protaetiibacter sp. WY-16]
MRAGIDSYSYHRLYGEIRAGERQLDREPWPFDPRPVLEHALSVGAEAVYLETCYLPEPEEVTAGMLDSPLDVGLSWGHPWPGRVHGLEGGRSWAAEQELGRWIDAAARLGHRVLRITAGSPASRGDEPAEVLVERLVGPLRRAARHAQGAGVRLALENHGDLRAVDIVALLDAVALPDSLGVCLDNVNLVRVGDDMLEGTRLLAPHTLLVQLKDHEAGDPLADGGPVCTALGDGVADLPAILDILQRADYRGDVCVEIASLGSGEVDELDLVGRSVTWLRENLP